MGPRSAARVTVGLRPWRSGHRGWLIAAIATGGLAVVACGGGNAPSVDPTRHSSPVTSVPARSVPVTSVPARSVPVTSIGSTETGESPSGVADGARRPEGFGTVVVAVTSPSGDVCELCLWLADDDDRRRRGLMFVDDLGPADGMAFVYDAPRTTAFTMRNTVLPLTIVFHDSDGRRLDAFDMDPCREEPCPSYPTPEGFAVAIEVEQGRADELGLVEGSTIEIVRRTGPDRHGDHGCDTPASHSDP